MKPLPSFLLGYGAGVGSLLMARRLYPSAVKLAALLLRRVESVLARVERGRKSAGIPLAGSRPPPRSLLASPTLERSGT